MVPTAVLPTFSSRAYRHGAVLLVAVTAAAWLFLGVLPVLHVVGRVPDVAFRVEGVLLILLVTPLAGSSMTYLVARFGAAARSRTHAPVAAAEAVDTLVRDHPSLTVLIPSYKEEPQVVWRTVMSAALQEFPDLRVVVLLDDPPDPADDADARTLHQVVEAVAWVDRVLGSLQVRLEARHLAFLDGVAASNNDAAAATQALVDDYALVMHQLHRWAVDVRAGNHESRFLADRVIGGLLADLEQDQWRLQAELAGGGAAAVSDVHAGYRRLRWIVGAEVSTFSRKRYQSLSHEPNKAMNINAYLGLMGGTYCDQLGDDGRRHVACACPGSWQVPETDYVLTLDADSALLPGYCLRLVEVVQRPDNADVAVIQTPYCAFPGPQSALERVAGATTDLLHVVHQGKTYFGATFWVGANAVIRTQALKDIAEHSMVDGVAVSRFIQDRTVIEDTESTVDLLAHGWRLVNYPDRLAYSATPPDFGSLVIQRRRWANGGLLILPKLLRHAWRSRVLGSVRGAVGLSLQLNYLTSIAVTNVCLLLLLLYPFDSRLLTAAVLALPIGYFAAMTWDLLLLGYRPWCAAQVYAMNLLLLPVNLAGVVMSLRQAATGAKIPFVRTPKVIDRVQAPPMYVVLPIILAAAASVVAVNAVRTGRPATAGVAGVMTGLLAYAVYAFVSPRGAISDVSAGIRLRRAPAPAHSARP